MPTNYINCASLESTEVSISGLSIVPNPSNKHIVIHQEADSEFNYSIMDLAGRVVTNGQSMFNEPISIESLVNGTYLFQIEAEGGERITRKIVKN